MCITYGDRASKLIPDFIIWFNLYNKASYQQHSTRFVRLDLLTYVVCARVVIVTGSMIPSSTSTSLFPPWKIVGCNMGNVCTSHSGCCVTWGFFRGNNAYFVHISTCFVCSSLSIQLHISSCRALIYVSFSMYFKILALNNAKFASCTAGAARRKNDDMIILLLFYNRMRG